MLRTKEQLVEKLNSEGFQTDEVIKSLNLLVERMRAVQIGKHTIHCVYNGKVMWSFTEKNSNNLDDYLYDLW
jgi:uncharacterized protein Smg (DUF494 family)